MQAKAKAYDEQNRYKLELEQKQLSTVLMEQSKSQTYSSVYQKTQEEVNQTDVNERQNKLREILMNKERTLAQMSIEKSIEQDQARQSALQAQRQAVNEFN